MKNLLFQLHWLLGLAGGVVLAIVGVTGAILSFEKELLAWMNPGVVTIAPERAERLAPPETLRRLVELYPERTVMNLEVSFKPARTNRVGFAPPPGTVSPAGPAVRRAEWHFVSPYTAQLLPEPAGESFFRTTMQIHRWLAAGDVGKHIVGASTVALLVLCVTGIYLRWPRGRHGWRQWTHIDFSLGGRAFLYRLHAVVGTWVLPLYLLAALTGLTWSYEWYRAGFYAALGATPPARPGPGPNATADPARNDSPADPLDVDQAMHAVWPVVVAEGAEIATATFTFPDTAGRPIEIRYLRVDAPHERATNRLVVDAATRSVVTHERYADKPLGAQLAGSIFPLHRGSFFGAAGTVLMMIASVLMPLFAATGLLMYLERRKLSKARTAHASGAVASGAVASGAVASGAETGTTRATIKTTSLVP